jgi:WD40 repeat protein
MTDVFISYAREDITFARRLNRALEETGLDTWIDWQDIPPSVNWLDEIYEAIEGVDAFVLILSGKSISSEISGKEVTFAIENNKRLIPIVIDDINPGDVPSEIAALNWIFFRESDVFEDSLQKLLDAIHTDQAWVKDHTRYYNRALEWNRHTRDRAFLLRDEDIADAERWLSISGDKEPEPAALHRDYIAASRLENTRRQRRVFGGLALGLLVAIGLSIFAFRQRSVTREQANYQATAEAQAVAEADARATANAIAFLERDTRATAQAETENQLNIALSQNLAAESLSLTSEDLDQKLLLGVAAAQFYQGVETYTSLHDAIMAEENFSGIVMDDAAFTVRSASLTLDGSRLAVGSPSGEIRIYDAQTGEALLVFEAPEVDDAIVNLALSADGRKLASVSETGVARYWDLTGETPESVLLSDFSVWDMFVAINSDGSEIAAVMTGNQIGIWDPLTGELLQILEKSNAQTRPMIFNRDGTQLAGFNGRESVHVWNRETGERDTLYIKLGDSARESYDRPDLNSQYTLAFHPEGLGLLVSTGSSTTYWDFETDELTSSGATYEIGFDSENDPVGFFLTDEGVYQEEIVDQDVSGDVIGVHFGGDVSGAENLGYLYSAYSEDFFVVWGPAAGGGMITRYTMTTWTPIGLAIGGTKDIRSLVSVPGVEEGLLISGGCGERLTDFECEGGIVKFWRGEEWDLDGDPIPAHADWISSIAVSPDGDRFITAGEDGLLILWDLASREPLGDPLEVDYIGNESRLKFHPSGDYAALYDGWDRIYLIDVADWALLGEPFAEAFLDEAEALRGFAFSPDGESIVVIHLGEGSTHTVDAENQVYEYLLSEYMAAPDGTLKMVSYEKAILAKWSIEDIATPQLDFSIYLKDNPADPSKMEGWGRLKDFYPVEFHPDGSRIAVGMEGTVLLIDAAAGKTLYSSFENEILDNTISDLVYSPSGQSIAVATNDGVIQLRDGYSGFKKGLYIVGSGTLQDDVLFSSDSELLFSVFPDSRIYVDRISFGTWMKVACEMVNREFTLTEWEHYVPGMAYQEVCAQTSLEGEE